MRLIGFYILSENIPAMVDFYTKVLGAQAVGEGAHYAINLPDGRGGFTIWDNGHVPEAVNERMALWFSVDSVDAEYDKLLTMQAEILEPPTDNPWGARHMVFCDPDGNRVRFITPAE